MVGNVSGSSGMGGVSAAQFQKQLFKKLDKNNDGSIDKTEFESALQSSGSGAATSANINKIFSAIDTSGDGKISESELSVFATKLAQKASDAKSAGGGGQGGPERAHGGGGHKSPPAAASGSTNSTSSTSQTFDPMDTNQDGVVSIQEEMAYNLAHPDMTKSTPSQLGNAISAYKALGAGSPQNFSSLLNVLV